MREFFDYRSPYRIDRFMEITFIERILPIVFIILGIYMIYKFQDQIRNNQVIEKRVRLTMGVSLTALYLSHYALRFALYGFDTLLLPFQLCSIAMILASILLFTKDRRVFGFVFFAGIMGTIITLINPVLGYNFKYYRYYQFYIAHSILILTPIYFLVVHHYIPDFRETIKSFLILQVLAIFMVIFNYYYGTDFMFLFLDPDKIDKFEMIKYLGGIPYYLIWVEILGFGFFMGLYFLVKKLYKNKELKEDL